MSVSQRAKRGFTHELPKDWEDEFHKLKKKYDELKFEFNEKENNNKL